MIQSREFPDSQSEGGYQTSSKIRSNKLSQEDQSSQNIGNQDSDQPDSQSQRSYDEQQSQTSQSNITKQEALEKQLLKLAVNSEQKRKPFQKEVMGQILDKLKTYQEAAREKQGEELVTLRIQELVYNKLLVLTYGCSEFRLALAHFHLGYAYLRHTCIEQAIEHISIAIHKNEKLFDQLQKNKLFQCVMKNILAQCLIKKQEYDDAIQVLQASIQLIDAIKQQKNFMSPEQVSNRARVLLTQCYCKHKQYDQAVKIIQEVLYNTKYVIKSQQDYAFALVQKATILATKDDYTEAITAQDQAINILIKINYPKPQQVAQLYGKLGDYYQKIGNSETSLACIQKLKTLYQQIYSAQDKRVIKARRRIATSLLKNDRFKEAVNQLLQIVELQEKVFGQSSIQTARTLKLLGTVYIRLETSDAKTYLKRAMNIFNAHGNKKQAQQIKEKLKLLIQGNNNNNDLKILSEQDL